eukprot:470828_1
MASSSCGFDILPKTVYAGVLNKKGQVNKAWKKRWFVLYADRKLAYYASQNDVVNCKDPINYIDLSKVTQVRVVNKQSSKPKRRKTFSMSSKSQSIGNLFSRKKSKNKLIIFDNDIVIPNPNNINAKKSIDMQFQSQFAFELVSPKRTYTLCCHHAASFNEWIDNLESSVFGKILYKGWITKQGEKRKTWKKRWFIIFNTKEMRYYEDNKRAKPKGSIFLTNLLTMRFIDDGIKYNQPNILELLTPNRLWVLSTYNKQNRQVWWNRISSMLPNCHQLSPIYEDHLFKYDNNSNAWIYRYFALDTKTFIQFDKIEDCERYKNCTYFNDDLHNIDFKKYVQLNIPLTSRPIIKRLHNQNDDNYNEFQKNNLFKIETNMGSYYFAADHQVQIERWFTAFKKLRKLRSERKQTQRMYSLRHQKSTYNHPLNVNSNEEYKENVDDILTDNEQEYKENDIESSPEQSLKPNLPIPFHTKAKTIGHVNDNDYASFAHEITFQQTKQRIRIIREKKMKNTHRKRHSGSDIESITKYKNYSRHRKQTNIHDRYYSSFDIKIRKTSLARTQRKRTLVAKRPDMNIVSALMALGFISENGCKRAALAVNNTSAELAATWLFDNMENPEVHEPLIYSDDNDDEYGMDYDELMDGIDDNNDMKICEDIDLNDMELKQIEDIPEYGLKADTYYKYKLWDEAKIYYTKAIKKGIKQKDKLIYKQSKDRDVNEKIYKWYCYRSECYRNLKKYPQAVKDTNIWMDMVVFNDDEFDFIEGCEIASGIWMDLRRFNASKVFIEKGLKIDENNVLLQKRLKIVEREINKELAKLSVEIDRNHLELTVDIEEKCDVDLSDGEFKDIVKGWLELIGNKKKVLTAKELFKQSADIGSVLNNENDIAFNECAQRLIFIMRIYGTWCTKVTQTDAIEFMSMYDILSMLNAYSVSQLINDYIHVKEVYIDNIRYRDIAWKYLQFKINDCFNQKIVKLIKKRIFRDKTVVDCNDKLRAELYFGYTESSDIGTLQILDGIYLFIFYSMEVIFDNNLDKDKLELFINNHQTEIMELKPNNYEEMYMKYGTNVYNNRLSYVNIGHKINNFIVNKQYKTLKQELFKNKIYKLSEFEWNDVLFKAKLFKKTYKCINRNWKANDEGFLNDEYNIKVNQPISLTHLIVLLLYTNNNKLRQTFMSNICNYKNCSETAHFQNILEECLQLFSQNTLTNKINNIFYHSISVDTSSQILLNDYVMNIKSPLSFTKHHTIAMKTVPFDLFFMIDTSAPRASTIVLELRQKDSAPLNYLNISYLSDRLYENECIVNQTQFEICDIYDQNDGKYNIWIKSLLLLKKVISGKYLLKNDYHSAQLYQHTIGLLMDNMIMKRQYNLKEQQEDELSIHSEDSEDDETTLNLVGQNLPMLSRSLSKNNKNAPLITTLILSKNKLKSLKELKYFKNLDTLQLDNNGLEHINDFPKLSKLKTLWLNNNNLKDVNALLFVLKKQCPKIEDLSFMFNPIAETVNRLQFIHNFKRLRCLNGEDVIDDEKDEAVLVKQNTFNRRYNDFLLDIDAKETFSLTSLVEQNEVVSLTPTDTKYTEKKQMDITEQKNSNEIPKYIQSMFKYLITTTKQLYLIKSQYKKQLTHKIWSRLMVIDPKSGKYQFGDFLAFWKEQNNLRGANFVEEFVWIKNVKQIFELKNYQELIGPKFEYPWTNKQKRRHTQQEFITFIPCIKRSKQLLKFLIKCNHFPHKISNIKLECNLFCLKIQYTISVNIYMSNENIDYECGTFPMKMIQDLDECQFEIALRILSMT